MLYAALGIKYVWQYMEGMVEDTFFWLGLISKE